MQYPKSIQNLIDQFSRLPGIGPKTAQRLVFSLLSKPRSRLEDFRNAFEEVKKTVTVCQSCCNYSETSPCEICADSKRDATLICVVAKPQDVITLEKVGEYNGRYHVLGGVLNPIDGVTPEKLRIRELESRIKQNGVGEVILALNPDIEGESTTLYIKKILQPMNIKVSRLARGLPMGADLEYADEVTLSNALKGRREV